jgi:hypothetical protein
MVESIFSIQLLTPFYDHYFCQEKHAPLRSCETWPRLNSCSRSVQSKGTPTGAYLAHPSIKEEAKVGEQVHDSFLDTLHLPIFSIYLLRSAIRLDTPSSRWHPMADRGMKCPMEESLEVVSARTCICVRLRWDGEGSSVTPPPEHWSPLLAISSYDDEGGMMSSCWWSS